MKKNLLTIGTAMLYIAVTVIFTSCGNTESQQSENHGHSEADSHEDTDEASHEHSTNTEESHESIAEYNGEKVTNLSLIIEEYLELKNALAVDNKGGAAEAGTQLLTAFSGFDKNSLAENQRSEYDEIEESALENTEHIVKSPIDHQREHLVVLSEDINDLIKLVGTDKKLYLDFCPMANNNKGAIWISEFEEISNPYMGSSMPKCGKVQSAIN